MRPSRFALSYGKVLLGLFVLLGLGPGRSGVAVDGDSVRVRMGWAFRAEIPRSAIRQAQRDTGFVISRGVHGFGGSWLVNGSVRGLVRLDIDPPARARMSGIPLRLHTLRLSLEAPDAFLDALRTGATRR